VPTSRGREFYFYLIAPHTADVRAFGTYATTRNTIDGEMLVGDNRWQDFEDLVFVPHYDDGADESTSLPPNQNRDAVAVLLTGGHRVGQTFTAEKNNLSGIWLPIKRLDQPVDDTRFALHLASPALLPYSEKTNTLRDLLIVILSGLVLWRLLPRKGRTSQLWIYLAVLAGSFALTQTVLKRSSNAGYAFPLIFQFAVVFHYWSWYVFSFDKLASITKRFSPSQGYQRLLEYMRQTPYFILTVVTLNVISGIGVLWYYRFAGQGALRYLFDYNCFLYVLVFHVTFSFRPLFRIDAIRSWWSRS
jgi:hypothetical protein